jgi:hypothetical protein
LFCPNGVRAKQAAEKLDPYSGKRQGTTSVVPQMQQNKRRALAPEACPFSLSAREQDFFRSLFSPCGMLFGYFG